jgi:hypothetical protein
MLLKVDILEIDEGRGVEENYERVVSVLAFLGGGGIDGGEVC